MSSKYFIRKRPTKVLREEYQRYYGPVAKPYAENEVADD